MHRSCSHDPEGRVAHVEPENGLARKSAGRCGSITLRVAQIMFRSEALGPPPLPYLSHASFRNAMDHRTQRYTILNTIA